MTATLDSVLAELAQDNEREEKQKLQAAAKAQAAFRASAHAAAKGKPPNAKQLRQILADAGKTDSDLVAEVNRLTRKQKLIAARAELLSLKPQINTLVEEINQSTAQFAQFKQAYDDEQERLTGEYHAVKNRYDGLGSVESELQNLAAPDLRREIARVRSAMPTPGIEILRYSVARLGSDGYTLAQFDADSAKITAWTRREEELKAELSALEEKLLTQWEEE